MDAQSLTVKVRVTQIMKDEEIRIDVPMRSIQGGMSTLIRSIPKLMKFYDRLGVTLKLHDYSYSFSTVAPNNLKPKTSSIKTHMIYNGASGRAGVGVPSTIYGVQSRAPLKTLSALVPVQALFSHANSIVPRNAESLDETHHATKFYIFVSGSIASVGFTSTHTNNSEGCIISGFSHIILATPTWHSAKLIESFASKIPKQSNLRLPFEEAVRKLRLFHTYRSTVITHRDAHVLPSHQNDWRDLNLVLESLGTVDHDVKAPSATVLTPGCTMATHIFPTPCGPPLCQTTNPIVSVDPKSILSQSVLDRSVLTVESKIARDSFCHPSSRGDGHREVFKASECTKRRIRLQGYGYAERGHMEGYRSWKGILKSERLEHSPLI
ncbi:microfibrillar-associated protein MFAP1, Zn finger, CCHC type protein [Rhizoctonia solani]|uniref:Microfibrillar-associated protein MFAP1, Zn finger, CCHC type protein n=1 Tax=Rhizoctonia solani TaxID=456999 RepID=A0A8H8NUQ0_9AGAM|nr:microfibrillar-associated protein MFAP1, Zn finger, CCHC type protein [Rhizoctonia solani]QRW18990.1 microfibrillar-associated protein MFAP1, Zn finger, CCHC type protein [Rhizoctonia solani]